MGTAFDPADARLSLLEHVVPPRPDQLYCVDGWMPGVGRWVVRSLGRWGESEDESDDSDWRFRHHSAYDSGVAWRRVDACADLQNHPGVLILRNALRRLVASASSVGHVPPSHAGTWRDAKAWDGGACPTVSVKRGFGKWIARQLCSFGL